MTVDQVDPHSLFRTRGPVLGPGSQEHKAPILICLPSLTFILLLGTGHRGRLRSQLHHRAQKDPSLWLTRLGEGMGASRSGALSQRDLGPHPYSALGEIYELGQVTKLELVSQLAHLLNGVFSWSMGMNENERGVVCG